MAKIEREQILNDIIKVLDELTSDWEYDGEISNDTGLFHDLEFESIDAVALGTAIEEYYRQSMPYAEFLTELGRQGVEDLTVGNLVDFVHKNLDPS